MITKKARKSIDIMTPRDRSCASLVSLGSQSSTHTAGEKVRMRFSYGGIFVKAPDGSWKYQGGNSYLETVPQTYVYSELIFRLSEKVQDAVAVKYQLPGEDLDPDSLISVCDDGDMQEMFDEYLRIIASPGMKDKGFRLRVFLFPAEEEIYVPEDLAVTSRRVSAADTFQLLQLQVKRQDSDPIPGIPHPEAHSPRKPGGSTSALPAKATSWSSMGSNLSTGSQQSSVSANRAGSRKNTVNEALHGRSPNPSEASAWEEGFRAGQEASFFADECDAMLWQDLLLSKLTRATKHFSFTDFAEIADYVADVADDKSLVADAPDWPVRMVAEAEKVIGIAPALPWTQPAASSGFGPVFVSQQTAAPKADKLGWRQQKPGDLAVDWRMAEAEQLMPHLSLADEAQDNYYLQAGDVQEINRVVDLAVGEVQDQVPTIKTPPAQEVNQRIELPKLGSDLGVGSVSIRPGTMKGVKLPSQLGIDLGNDDQIMEANLNGNQRLISPGNQASPGSSYLLRQWSASSSQNNAVHYVPANEVKVLCKIGEGAFGEVSLATVPIFGKVAIKWLKPGKLGSHSESFWQEAELLGGLNHPHVIRFFGVVVESANSSQVVGIMTEYMAGGSLSALLQASAGPPTESLLPMRRRAELALGAANGMSYLHELRIVHFDLKPDNLLVDGDLNSANAVKVADFGLSKHKYAAYVSNCRDLRGTLPYMAPELISDPDHVSEKADVWSMGIVMWELAAREAPYANMSPQEIVAGLMKGYLRPEIPDWVEDEWRLLIESCLDSNPQARPSFRELAARLERLRDEAAFLTL